MKQQQVVGSQKIRRWMEVDGKDNRTSNSYSTGLVNNNNILLLLLLKLVSILSLLLKNLLSTADQKEKILELIMVSDLVPYELFVRLV